MEQNYYHHADIATAQRYAVACHDRQMYGEKPYFYHLMHVVQVAQRFGYQDDTLIIMACWLHDVVEDTESRLIDIPEPKACSGMLLRDVIDAVSDRPGETKADVFRERTSKLFPAIIVKLCDRIANIEACLAEDKQTYLKRYLDEDIVFWEHIGRRLPQGNTLTKQDLQMRRLYLYYQRMISLIIPIVD